MSSLRTTLMVCIASALLAGCGGGDAGAPSTPAANLPITATPPTPVTPPIVAASSPALVTPPMPLPQQVVGAAAINVAALLSTNPSATPGTTTAAVTPTQVSPPATPQGCTIDEQRAWLRADMDSRYFWFDQQAKPNPAASSMPAYFDALLFKPTDTFSYAQSEQQFTQLFSDGTRTGYGYSLAFTDAQLNTLKVSVIEPLSPMARAGIKRGDVVLAIDGFSPSQIAAGALAAVSTAGVPRRFSLRGIGALGQVVAREVTVVSANFALSPLLATATFTLSTPQGTVKVGYLAYQQFIGSSEVALKTTLNRMYAAGVQELILDLRYNGGGSVNTARNLASLIGGDALQGRTFAQLTFNAKSQASNQIFRFVANQQVQIPFSTFSFVNGVFREVATGGTPDAPVISSSLRRVFVLASPSTASASELVINGLRPFMPVVQIGGTTNGKPYGFAPRSYCGTVYNAVNFDSVNALGVGGYVNGLPATCNVPDDLDHLLGDAAEGRTAAALRYITSGACPASTGPAAPAGLALRSKPIAGMGESSPPQMFLD